MSLALTSTYYLKAIKFQFEQEISLKKDDGLRLNGPRREKTCRRGFRQSKIQISLLRYRDYLEN